MVVCILGGTDLRENIMVIGYGLPHSRNVELIFEEKG